VLFSQTGVAVVDETRVDCSEPAAERFEVDFAEACNKQSTVRFASILLVKRQSASPLWAATDTRNSPAARDVLNYYRHRLR
jgi:hypothetical protein